MYQVLKDGSVLVEIRDVYEGVQEFGRQVELLRGPGEVALVDTETNKILMGHFRRG